VPGREGAVCAAPDRAVPPPRLGRMTAHHVMVLSGPNLGRLGSREPEIYGSETLADIATAVTREGDSLGLAVDFRQSNDEAELIGWIHEAVDAGADVVLNPAAFTHYSYALRDACAMVTGAGRQLVEVHLSNPAARESFRHTSVVSGVATGTIAGFGSQSYLLALRALVS
jgi:3-dehydroquinate dehydratase II